jgi:hypothetical protein
MLKLFVRFTQILVEEVFQIILLLFKLTESVFTSLRKWLVFKVI